jgi:uncharacterized protein
VKLFCDEMLGRLGRWLRAAGYDTATAEGGTPDNDILARCVAERRTIITRDRHLETRTQGRVPVVRLSENGIEAQARALRTALGLDWQHAPFTRCLLDNTPLGAAPPEMSVQVPPSSRAAVGLQPTGLSRGGPLRLCPACVRLYWPGGHVRRMQARLAAWNALG